MATIIECLQSKKGLMSGVGADEDTIDLYQNLLGIDFANDYKEYLRTFGIVAFSGRELTGISKTDRLNVVEATKNHKSENPNIADDMYLVEYMDGIAIWQDTSGKIYKSVNIGEPKYIAKSLVEYYN